MALSGNLYRFEAGCDDEYEAVRASGDAALGLVAPDTCIEPAATAYRDSRGRLMLRVSSSSAVYAAIASSLDQLVAVGTVVVNPGEEPAPSAAGAVVTADLADGAVTYAKLQNVSATDRLLGRSTAGSGVVEEIVCTAAGRALIDDADAAAQRTTLGAQKAITSGTAAPTGGSDGDIYLQYS